MALRPDYSTYRGGELFQPAGDAAVVVPTNTSTGDAAARISTGIWVGGAGDVAVVFAGGSGTAVVLSAVPAGTLLPVRAVRVASTGTTATLMTFLYGVG